METLKTRTGIKLLIAFYCFIIFQHFMMRGKFQMNAGVEAVLLGTLVYLVVGFIRRKQISRWMAMGFHVVFQVLESIAVFLFLKPDVLARLTKDIPGTTLETARFSLMIVFVMVTAINISAIVYLWKNGGYFSAGGRELEESGA